MNYKLVLGMKVKTCVNSPYTKYNGWGKVGSDFPRIYVWIVTRSKELNVTIVCSGSSCLKPSELIYLHFSNIFTKEVIFIVMCLQICVHNIALLLYQHRYMIISH